MKKMSKSIRDIDLKEVKTNLTRFIGKTVKSAGFNKVIFGLSGGLDSGVIAYLSKEALGAKNIIAAILPYNKIDPDGIRLANQIIDELKIKKYIINIAPMLDGYFKNYFSAADNIRRGNKMARERMAILYDLSKKENALVIGSSNKTETLLGYCTLYGDTACALKPLVYLYKTQVSMLAEYLGLPKTVIKRKPTAGLWEGQTDEEEIGYSYNEIDKLLWLMFERRMTDDELKKEGFDKKFINDIRKRIKKSEFKRKTPLTPLK